MTAERFPVEESHIMMFARAIGGPNPVYRDPDSSAAKAMGGIIAPPTFAMAAAQFDPENPLIPQPGEPWFGSAKEASGYKREGTGLLHAEQHFEYHRPLRAGEVLRGIERSGETWQKESKRGGTLNFAEKFIDYVVRETGDKVVTVRMVSVVPSQVVTQD